MTFWQKMQAWAWHLTAQCIHSTAMAVRSTFIVSTAGQVTGLQLSWEALGMTAGLGFLAGLVDALIEHPLPELVSVTEETTEVTTTTTKNTP